MNRGRLKHIYIQKLFDDEPMAPAQVFVITRGRNSALINSRNLKLAYRYYFKSKLQQKGYEKLLGELSAEFDLSHKTIYNVLFIEQYQVLNDIMKQKPTVKELRQRYPYFAWQ